MRNSAPREFQDIRISVPWGYVDGRWYGNRDVRPILAIHGWLDNLGTWETLIPLLPSHVGILCIDLPGHGRSSKYPKGITYHVRDYVHIVQRVMQEYKWQKVSLLGHSMGAIVSFAYASMYPRTVDLLIQIDIIVPVIHKPEYKLKRLATNIEKTLIEDERVDKMALYEPPSYTYAELERILYEGSSKSVDLQNCKYMLDRSITRSKKYPDKYYFSRDGKLKFYVEFTDSRPLALELARRIRNVPYLVVKGSRSHYISEDSGPVIAMLRENNAHFEMHTIEGTHHVHLNNPQEVAAVLNPFINTHRPAILNTWSVDDESFGGEAKAECTESAKKGTRGPLKWLRSKL